MNELERVLRDQREELESTDFSQFVTRREESQLELDSPVAQIVIGVRRCGKSTLCQKVLKESGVSFAYANFDDAVLASLKATEMNQLWRTFIESMGSSTISSSMRCRISTNGRCSSTDCYGRSYI